MTVYLSGPITGTTDYLSRFEDAEHRLHDMGFTVVNPAAVNDRLPHGSPYEMYMATSLAMLEHCDAICMLPGWQKSNGAKKEKSKATVEGLAFIDFVTGMEV